MIIGIDGNEANVERKVGIGEYAFELLLQFYKSQSPNSKFQFTIYLKSAPLTGMPKERDGWKYRVIGPKKLWTRFALPVSLFIKYPKPDVFFTPTNSAPLFSPVPVAISIMDLSFLHFHSLFAKKDLYQLTNWTHRSMRQAKKVFTISEFSKNDIIKTYKTPEADVIVTYPGIKQDLRLKIKDLSMEELKKKYKIDKPFILFVGTLQPRKNITKLVEALSKLKNKEVDLIVIGKKGWLYEEILEAPKKFSVEDRVKFLDFVGDDDLPSFYKNALCFCLPSLYEGFGLPVLEAMQHGCPVVTSNVSSLPEAGGDAAIYFNPEDASDIAAKIDKVISNETLRKEMAEKGYNQVKKFSWEKAAKQTLEVLEELGK
jgi:glycosyltransferase involved in cell wall biosynthesis